MMTTPSSSTSSRPDFLTLIAIGDSYGMKYEFVAHTTDKTIDDLVHGPHPRFTGYPVGHYTDDTQMSLANLELLLLNVKHQRDESSSVSVLTARDFIETWLSTFHRDPHVGYSRHMWGVMSNSRTAEEFTASLDPSRGTTSGAAMRAGPFGLLTDIDKVKQLTELQARITHDTVPGVNAALAVALSVHYLHHGGTRKGLDEFLATHLGADWNSRDKMGHPKSNRYLSNGLTIVMQAPEAVQRANTCLLDVLLNVVNDNETSDMDTVAAISMAIAAKCCDLVDDLPQTLRDGVENGSYGRDYLQQIDQRAAAAFPPMNLYGI